MPSFEQAEERRSVDYRLERNLREVLATVAKMGDSDASHCIEIFFTHDILENRAVARLKDDKLSWTLLHERVPKPMHLMRLVRSLEVLV